MSKNILIAPNQGQGRQLIEAMGSDPADWLVISYLGVCVAHKADTLVIIQPNFIHMTAIEAPHVAGRFDESVDHMKARAKNVVEIG